MQMMSAKHRLARIAAAGLAAAAGLVLVAVPSHADVVQQSTMVSDQPAAWTPNVLDGKVRQTATVGGVTVAVGDFTQVTSNGSSTVLNRQDIFAFDSSGQVSSTFTPLTNGSDVNDVIDSGDGHSVYIAGSFSDVNGVAKTGKIARVDVNTGQVLTSFRSPAFNLPVTDIQLINGKLYVAGQFTTVNTQPRSLLTVLDPSTGAEIETFDATFGGTWNGGRMGITHMTVSPDGTRMVVVGNFRTVNTLPRIQIAMFDLGSNPNTLDSWATDGFSHICSSHFKTYVNDVDIDPNSTYFVVGDTGAFSGGAPAGTLCDAVSRFELHASGPGQMPTWVEYTGGDTVTQVEATGNAIYIGGHFRWLNNPYVGDAVGPGAVKRQGLGALDPRNGMPLSWAPTVRRHWGIWGFRSTDDGLWVTFDSDAVNGLDHRRIAFFPIDPGATMPADNTGTIPGDVYLLGTSPANTDASGVLYRVNAGGPALLTSDSGPNWSADTASAPSPYHNSGSSAASWSQTFGRTAAVPVATPQAVFSDERWDSGSSPEMSWDFPVAAGTPVQVRLYMANGCSCTQSVGSRIFNVKVDGASWLSNYDIVASVGNNVGTMVSYNTTSDGDVNIDFSHIKENPLLSAVEIVRSDVTPPTPTPDTFVQVNAFDGTSVTGTSNPSISNFPTDWNGTRGAFMVDRALYYGKADGNLYRRTWAGTKFSTESVVPLNGLAAFSNEVTNARSMFYDRTTGRLYFTEFGDPNLYYRYFEPQSRIVGGQRFTAPVGGAGVDWTQVRGAFLAGSTLYLTQEDGSLASVQWVGGATVGGTLATVSGPSIDGQDWRAKGVFLFAG